MAPSLAFANGAAQDVHDFDIRRGRCDTVHARAAARQQLVVAFRHDLPQLDLLVVSVDRARMRPVGPGS